jgi:hypothetical protein
MEKDCLSIMIIYVVREHTVVANALEDYFVADAIKLLAWYKTTLIILMQ